jgi:tRNA(Ile)-lysidine synthase TilS/MesJ
MTTVVFHDKVGGSMALRAEPGQALTAVLRAHGIPTNSILAYRNGQLESEDVITLREHDLVELRQVRHYDLGVVRDPRQQVFACPDPIYAKRVLFDTNGAVERRVEQFNRDTFPTFVESTFVQSVLRQDVVRAGDRVVVGLSGGRDSVAYLTLLDHTGDKLPPVEMTAVTITGLPDWEEPETFGAAMRSCEKLGIEQVVVDAAAVQEMFRLRKPFAEVMNQVVAGEHRHMNMLIGHQVLRRMLERVAEDRGANVIAWGFNADDLVASLVTWFTSGYRMGGIPVRDMGAMRYVFPLYQITKKELTLYLELVAPELTKQGPPGRFTTGNDERSLSYAIADHLYDLWPGIDYYLFNAFRNIQRSMLPIVQDRCRVCQGNYLLQEGTPNPAGLCDVCDFFARQELTVPTGP